MSYEDYQLREFLLTVPVRVVVDGFDWIEPVIVAEQYLWIGVVVRVKAERDDRKR